MEASPATPNTETSQPVAERVPRLQKFGYGLGSVHDMWGHWLYMGLAFQVFNIYLGVSPAWIARALLCKLVFEAAWDSVFGWWSDNTRTRFGRRRPFILVGSVLAGLMLPAMFMVQHDWREIQYFWFMVGSMALLVPFMSCFYMPFQSLGYELTPDYNERTTVQAWRSAMQKVPEVAMFAAAAFTTAGVWVGATWGNVPERLAILATQTVHWFGDVASGLFVFDFPRLGVLMKTLFGWAPGVADAKPNILVGAQVYTLMLGSIMVLAGIGVFFSPANATTTSSWSSGSKARSPSRPRFGKLFPAGRSAPIFSWPSATASAPAWSARSVTTPRFTSSVVAMWPPAAPGISGWDSPAWSSAWPASRSTRSSRANWAKSPA